MIPAARSLLGGYAFAARRRGWTTSPNERAFGEAVEEARALAMEPRDEPAALFYALARRPRVLREAWPVLPALLMLNHAGRLRLYLAAGDEELDRLRVAIVVQRLTFEHVREWFRARLEVVP
jgi:hypothetical protein